MMKVAFAAGGSGEFGYKNRLPWGQPFKCDMSKFIAITTDCILVMGRHTFESLPTILRGLDHVVVSSSNRFDIKTKDGLSPTLVLNLNDLVIGRGGTVGNDSDTNAAFLEWVSYIEKFTKKELCIIGGPNLIMHALPTASEVLFTEVVAGFGPTSLSSDVEVNVDAIETILSDKFKLQDSVYSSERGYGVFVGLYSAKPVIAPIKDGDGGCDSEEHW